MNFINKENQILVASGFVNNSLNTLLEFATEFSASYNRTEIDLINFLADETAWNFILGDTRSKTFNDGGFTYTSLTDEDWV